MGKLSYAAPKHLYVGKPVEEIKALNAQKSKDYQESRLENDKLDIALKNLDVRDVDFEGKKGYIEGLKSRMKGIVDNGDWENAKYNVIDEVKKFSTDPFLNSAKKAKVSESEYNADLKKRYDEGLVSEEVANYAKATTKNLPIEIQPDGKAKGGFEGRKILNDKQITKEIYDQADKRIKDWKENKTLIADGKEYMKAGDGQYFVKGSREVVDPAEVKQALVNEVKNSYGDFLQQEKEIDLYKIKGGKNRPTELQDFSALGLKDGNEILSAKGLSDADISKMESSKDPQEKKYAEIAKNEKKVVEAKLSTPEGRDEVFNSLYDKYQINKYVQGATDKASYIKEDADWMLDHDHQEDLKFRHAKALKDYDEDLKEKDIIAPPSNIHALEEYSLKDNEGFNTTIEDYNNQIKTIKQELQNPNLPTIEKNKLLNTLSDIQNKSSSAYDDKLKVVKGLSRENPEVGEAYIKYGLLPNSANQGVLAEIIKNPSKYSTQLGGYARQLERELNENMSKGLDATPIDQNKIKILKTLIDKQKDNEFLYKVAISNSGSTASNYDLKVFADTGSRSTESYNFSSKRTPQQKLQELETKALEKTNINLASAAKTYGVTKELKPESDAFTDLFRNQETSATRNGLNWDKFIQDQDLTDEKGKEIVAIENKNIEAYPEINWAKGEKSVRLNVLNAYTESKEGQKTQASWSFVPGDESSVDVTLRSMGNKLISSKNPDAKNAGREMLSFSMYGKELKGFNPQAMGDKTYTDIQAANGVVTILADKSKSGETFKVYVIKKDNQGRPINGTEKELKLQVPGESTPRSDFRSNKDLAEALYYSQFETK